MQGPTESWLALGPKNVSFACKGAGISHSPFREITAAFDAHTIDRSPPRSPAARIIRTLNSWVYQMRTQKSHAVNNDDAHSTVDFGKL